jgi:secondary thiamine-phosphate synthase enzyme
MTTYHQTFKVQNDRIMPIFHDVSDKVREILMESKVKNGIAVVYSQHTTCSVIIQEESQDTTYYNTKYINQDLLDILEKVIPECRKEGQYMHPGPEHMKIAMNEFKEQPTWSLNTDAHLKSCIMGHSESIPIIEGKLELGEFGRIYFVDFDSVRKRERTVHIQIVGE